MAKYPIYLELSGKRVVVIGGGVVALRKVQDLLSAGARVVVISKDIDQRLNNICQGTDAELIRSKYSKQYLTSAVLVIAATNDAQLNQLIYKDCQELEILCNVVDNPQLCDFFTPAVVKRGSLQIAIGTEGNCPAYAGHIRKKLQKLFGPEHESFLAHLEKLRKKIITQIPDPVERKTILGKLVDEESFEYFVQNGEQKWSSWAQENIEKAVDPTTRGS